MHPVLVKILMFTTQEGSLSIQHSKQPQRNAPVTSALNVNRQVGVRHPFDLFRSLVGPAYFEGINIIHRKVLHFPCGFADTAITGDDDESFTSVNFRKQVALKLRGDLFHPFF